MKVYIAGPMSGYEDLNFPAFFKAEEFLKARGDDVVNPARINPDLDADWLECMITDLKWLGTCDKIYLLKGWEFSNGAQIEFLAAEKLGLEIETQKRE